MSSSIPSGMYAMLFSASRRKVARHVGIWLGGRAVAGGCKVGGRADVCV